MQDKFIDAPTALNQLVRELNHSGKPQYLGLLVPVPTRLQAHLYGMVEALTHHAGTSRNKLMNQLVEVGIQATLQALPEEVVFQLQQSSDDAIQTVCKRNAGLLERGGV